MGSRIELFPIIRPGADVDRVDIGIPDRDTTPAIADDRWAAVIAFCDICILIIWGFPCGLIPPAAAADDQRGGGGR